MRSFPSNLAGLTLGALLLAAGPAQAASTQDETLTFLQHLADDKDPAVARAEHDWQCGRG